MTAIGERIKEARKAAGISQSELAVCLRKTLRTVQKYESGEIEPSFSMVEQIAYALKVAPEYIFGFRSLELSHLMMIEIEEDYGLFKMPKVVLFNANHLTQEEALRLVTAGEYHPSVLSIPERQWASLFLNQKEGK